MTLSGTITGSALDTEFDAERANLNAAAADTPVRWWFEIVVDALDSSTAQLDRQVEFVPPDDVWLVAIGAEVFGAAATTINTTATLEGYDEIGDAGLDDFLLGKTVSQVVQTTAAAEVQGRTQFTSTTGDRHALLKGVRYRLVLSSDSATASDRARAWVLVESKRRR